jgi:alpha-ketoglutarate-dependent taurine dioxygenase
MSRATTHDEVIGNGLTSVAVVRGDGPGKLAAFADAERGRVDELVTRYGSVLFRGFEVTSLEQFAEVGARIGGGLYGGNHEHQPVSADGLVQTPVAYSAERKLLWHHENAFNDSWPLRLMFCCSQPAATGGETPLADARRVLERVDPDALRRFLDQGVMYVRTFGAGVGLDWRTVMDTTDRAGAEQYCAEHGMAFEWLPDDVLRTRAVRPAVVRHPQTGEWCWFAQLHHWHPSCLDEATREALLSLFEPDEMPRNCYYGDGSPIDDAFIIALGETYAEVESAFAWERGDVLLVDNVLTAHARNPYTGARRMLVALGDMRSFDSSNEVPRHV